MSTSKWAKRNTARLVFVDGPTTRSNHQAFACAFRARGVTESDIVAAYVGTERHPDGDRVAQFRIDAFRPLFRFA